MSSQLNESPAEDIRNALQILKSATPGLAGATVEREEVEAIRARLEAALTKLEAPPMSAVGARAWNIAMDAARGILLHAKTDPSYPDLEERRGAASEPPLDYERPGQVDPVLRGQPIDSPNYDGE